MTETPTDGPADDTTEAASDTTSATETVEAADDVTDVTDGAAAPPTEDAGTAAGSAAGTASEPPSLAALLEQEGEIAADYIEGLLDIADLDGDLDMDVEGERAMVSVVGASLHQLVGDRGEVLESLQELTRLAVHQRTGVRSRLMVDISGWRAQRRADLTELGRKTAEDVRTAGEPTALDPMTPFERKAVHDAVADVEGVISESEGDEPKRYIVIRPAVG